jgi:CheY-like chemotaxis protein
LTLRLLTGINVSEHPPIVLIAEDNPCLARVLSFKFKSCGFTTIVCEDGQVAWDAYEANSIAAIVSDHEMPMMSGVELASQIRANDLKIPIFLVTGRQLELPAGIAEKLQITIIFGKPFSPADVVSAVSEAIQESTHC